MKITIESKDDFIEIGGVTCRVWEGETEKGIAVKCAIHRVVPLSGMSPREFEDEVRKTTLFRPKRGVPV